MKRISWCVSLLFVLLFIKSSLVSADTIPYWYIKLDDKVIIRGNSAVTYAFDRNLQHSYFAGYWLSDHRDDSTVMDAQGEVRDVIWNDTTNEFNQLRKYDRRINDSINAALGISCTMDLVTYRASEEDLSREIRVAFHYDTDVTMKGDSAMYFEDMKRSLEIQTRTGIPIYHDQIECVAREPGRWAFVFKMSDLVTWLKNRNEKEAIIYYEDECGYCYNERRALGRIIIW